MISDCNWKEDWDVDLAWGEIENGTEVAVGEMWGI